MIKFEDTVVFGFQHAIKGMRNPMNSWDKSDTKRLLTKEEFFKRKMLTVPEIGENDLDLMKRLRAAGTDHRKYLRMIVVYVDVTAPLYWWKEFDTYKIGTVANSCSTMHKIQAKEFTPDDFSHEHLIDDKPVPCTNFSSFTLLDMTIRALNYYREQFLETKDKRYWWQMIQLLPTSYNQKRTIMLSYEVLNNIHHSRRIHKLDEWSKDFMDWIETLPYAKELIIGEEKTMGED